MLPLPKPVLRAAALAVTLALAGCGSSSKSPPTAPSGHSTASRTASSGGQDAAVSTGCAATVMRTLGRVLERVYHEGVESQRTGSAAYEITSSTALRAAVQARDPAAARRAAQALIHTGHLTRLRLLVGGRTFIDVGAPAITPLTGTLPGANGEAIATYITSVWSVEGFLAELGGVVEGYGALLEGNRGLRGSFPLGHPGAASAGTLTHDGVTYSYTSFPGEAFPSGVLRIYLLRAASTIAPLCRSGAEDTTLAVLEHIAHLIYAEELGPPARKQIARVEANRPLREAVAHRDPAAVEAAIKALLNEHIVRLRVFGPSGELLGDVGGPYVLAPVHGTIRAGTRQLGSFVLSIQDDEGYEKLAKRLEGLPVLVYYDGQIVKNSLGAVAWSEVPASGSFSYQGRDYRVFTVNARAFPSGPLTVRVLVPEPYLAQPLG